MTSFLLVGLFLPCPFKYPLPFCAAGSCDPLPPGVGLILLVDELLLSFFLILMHGFLMCDSTRKL